MIDRKYPLNKLDRSPIVYLRNSNDSCGTGHVFFFLNEYFFTI